MRQESAVRTMSSNRLKSVSTGTVHAPVSATPQLPEGHPEVRFGRTGVLLVNLGTPDGHDRKNMRRYLKEFLSDPRVIELPRLLWWPILHGIILNVRPTKSGKLYASIWNEELDESPLRTFSRNQGERLAARFSDDARLDVDWAMRYGNPSIPDRLARLRERGCDRILIVPLYPQYSAATTASVCDKTFDALRDMRWMPALRTTPAFHDDPAYIEALARNLEAQLEALDFEPEKILASYHGVPTEQLEKGDPYHCHCHKTSRLLRERMGWSKDRLITCFQSRFGPKEWLQPFTDETVRHLAAEGVKDIAVFNPGFVSDCLETLEEIAVEVKGEFLDAGGRNFVHLPCLNDSGACIDMLEALVRRELGGWL
jgi:ferrochelatase